MADLEVLPHEADDINQKQHRDYQQLIEEIKETFENPKQKQILTLARLLYDRTGDEIIGQYHQNDVKGYLEFLLEEFKKFPDTDDHRLTIFNPTQKEDGWESPHTIIHLVIDDLPFVVDSLYELLKKEKIHVRHAVFNPMHVVWGKQNSIEEFSTSDASPQTFFVSLQVEAMPEDRQDQIRSEIESLLSDLELSVRDLEPMLDKARKTTELLEQYKDRMDTQKDLLHEAQEFIEYLIDGNFVFLGYREYNLFEEDEQKFLQIVPDSGLGILRREEMSTFYEPKPLDQLDEQLQKRIMAGFVLSVTKANSESRIYRREPLDYIGIKKLDNEGEITGEIRFLGLFTNRVMAEPAVDIPLLRQKFEDLIEKQGIEEHTHTYRDVYSIYNSMPKHLLFMSPIEELIEDIKTIISSHGSNTFDLRARPDIYHRGISLMVIMSKERFNQDVRESIQSVVEDEFEPESVDYRLSLGQGDQARLHFHLQTKRRSPRTCSFEELENHLFEITRTWSDNLEEQLREKYEQQETEALIQRYQGSFPEEYQILVPPSLALRDIENLEALRGSEEPPRIDFVNPAEEQLSHLIFYHDKKFRLSDIMGLITNHGLSVIEQSTFEINMDEQNYFLHLFRIQDPENQPISEKRQEILLDSIRSVYMDVYRDDILNELVTTEGLNARMLNLFRLYKNYFHQLQPAIKLESINRTLITHSSISRNLFQYFEARFDPTLRSEERKSRLEDMESKLTEKLENISDRNHYQILKSIFNQMQSTVRTNYYQAECSKSYISVKINCEEIESMPKPRPLYEIFVYSPLMEAIHLRGGKIARGGIRWSDRRDDFRTEVLDLMKTQMVKNSLIVPVGSKGGFVLKQEHLEGKDLREHAKEQYQVFMRGMLDLTDNLEDDQVVHPKDVVCYDGEDPYHVVAADKGTAHLSDTANEVARNYNYWLDDAFASGGSVGFDHKELGITARGAWESVERHFRELGQDIHNETFTVAGIGDMGGDVFGNGMILSDQIKLVAAFNHLHIFVDPDPDPAKTFKERKRLFEEAGGWDQYDESLLSKGGGIHDRDAKFVDLSDEARELLKIDQPRPNGEEVIQAILRLNVDLLWNGGIGTYIKSSEQTHSEVGDAQNDECRVDADQVQARIIGEGGNLGITQEGRIELDRLGVRLNTDAIDNSGGVDLSDHEVNLKIALQESIKSGELNTEQREELLLSLTDEVVNDVTRDNYRQSGAISLESIDSEQRMGDFRHLLDVLEDSIQLNRGVENLPNERDIQDRIQSGEGLTRPELAVLLSYSKMDLYNRAMKADWNLDNIISPFLEDYFPQRLLDDHPGAVKNHPLKKEIALTSMINYVVDYAGFSFIYRLEEVLAADILDILKWYLVADNLSRSHEIRSKIFDLDNKVPADSQYRAWQCVRDNLGNATSWFYDALRSDYKPGEFQRKYFDDFQKMEHEILKHLDSSREKWIQTQMDRWTKRGFSESFSRRLSRMPYLTASLDIVYLYDQTEFELDEIAKNYLDLGSELHIDWIMQEIQIVDPDQRWDQFAYQNLSLEINNTQRILTERILKEGISPRTFLERNPRTASRLEEIRNQIDRERKRVFSSYQFMVQRIKSLV